MSQAELRFRRADRLYRIAIKVFFAFVLVMLIIIASQVAALQNDFSKAQTKELNRLATSRQEAAKRLEKALSETQKQQVVTQMYIRCIALVSLKPVDERSAADYDACGIPGVTDSTKLGQVESSTPTKTAPVATQQPESNPPAARNQETTSGAPPKDEGSHSFLDQMPLVGGIFRALGI